VLTLGLVIYTSVRAKFTYNANDTSCYFTNQAPETTAGFFLTWFAVIIAIQATYAYYYLNFVLKQNK